jgi:hypothetical protein
MEKLPIATITVDKDTVTLDGKTVDPQDITIHTVFLFEERDNRFTKTCGEMCVSGTLKSIIEGNKSIRTPSPPRKIIFKGKNTSGQQVEVTIKKCLFTGSLPLLGAAEDLIKFTVNIYTNNDLRIETIK